MVADATPTVRKSAGRIPLPVKLKARSLYLIHGLPLAEIAQQTGLTSQSVKNLAFNEGWSKTRLKAKEALVKRADARMNEEIDEVSDAIATESEEIAMSGLVRARESTQDRGEFAAKDFQAWTGGARNLVNISRACRGQDAKKADGAGESASVSFFVIRVEDAEPAAMRNVTPGANPGAATLDTPSILPA
jgi:hypothetical protein